MVNVQLTTEHKCITYILVLLVSSIVYIEHTQHKYTYSCVCGLRQSPKKKFNHKLLYLINNAHRIK